MRFGRLAVCLFTAYLFYGAFALAQVDGLQSFPASSTVSVPRLIRTNGSLRDETGRSLTGNIGVTFTLYKDANGQFPVWQEYQSVRLDSAGRYSVLLGATNDGGLPLEIFSAGEARWLGVRVDGQLEQPRILFLSVAYALKAADSDMLGGKPASAFVLAGSQNSSAQQTSGAQPRSQNSQSSPQVLDARTLPLLTSPTVFCSVGADGTGTANQIAKFSDNCDIVNSAIFESGGNVGIGNTSPAAMLDVSGTAYVRGLLSALGGVAIAPSGTATASQGYISSPLDIQTSLFNTILSRAANYIFRWQAEPVGNDTTSTSATLNLLYGVTGNISETGISVNNKGILTFAPNQTFPGTGTGTVMSVNTGAGLTGGPITNSGTISIPSNGVTNAMLANNSVTVTAGSGLSGGGTVALGGTITLTNASPSSGGTVTSISSGTGLIGGPITTNGTLSLNTAFTDARYLQLAGGTLTGGLSGTTAAFTGGLAASSGTFSSTLSAAGALLPKTGTATTGQGFNSNPFDLQASSFNSSNSSAITQDFRWQAEPTGNDSSNPSGSLNLLFGSNGNSPTETGLSIASNGHISFASGQTFPGTSNGTVTGVNTGAGLTGGPITTSGTISIPSAGVTNAMLANNSVTVQAGPGLSGGGTVALGGTITLTNASPSSGGTVTGVNTGAGLAGGPITTSGTISIPSNGVTNTMLANNSVTVTAGPGLSGGGTVALGGTVTLTNASPSSGGTVTNISSGTGLTGGPISTSGTLNLDTNFTDARYLQLSGGALTGGLSGTTAAFTSGTFSSTLSAAGALLPGTNTATATQGFNSNPFDLQASSFSSSSSSAITQDFRWQAEPTGNNSSNASGSLNLLFGSNGNAPTETGLSIASNGLINFASGQTFPGTNNGTVTGINTGAGLTGGPITTSGTISIPSAGVTNAMLANNSVTVQAGPGLSGGGTVALGGTVTITNAAPSSGGTITSISSGTGLTGGTITTSGTLNLDTNFTDARYLQLSGGALTGGLSGTTATFTGGLAASSGTFTSRLSAAGALLPGTDTATAAQGFNSNPFDLQASSFSSSSSSAIAQDFRWQAEPTGNNSSNPSGSLNLLFGSNGNAPTETGLSIASNGLISFAPSQTFPGTNNGTVTGVNTGAGLTGGPITTSGTISIPSAGVTNSMLANPFVTVQAGPGLSGGGTVALGGTVTITNASPSSGGTVTSVSSGTGLTGGPITTSGTLNLDTNFTDARYLQLTGGAMTGALSGTTATFTSTLSAAGALLPGTDTATAAQGFTSNPFDLQASSFSSDSSSPITEDFRWQAEPTGNNSSNPSASLNLLFGSTGNSPSETGLSIASNGLISFAPGQTFPSADGGTVTSINTGAGLAGGPITSSGTISIPSAGVTNSMLANNSVTVQAGPGLSGGGTVALGGTITLTNASPSSGGTVTGVNTGAGLAGGPITTSGTISIPSAGVTNAMLANNSVTVTAGPGLSGGGTVALGGTVTITNASPSSGGTITSISSGTGLTGGPITTSGTLNLDTNFTDARYLQLSGGALTGGLSGTTATFTGGLAASSGTFTGRLSAAGALLPGTNSATATQGFNSNPFDLQASSFSSSSSSPITQDFRWQAEPTGNNSSNPSGSLNLLFGSNGNSPTETGLSIASNGVISFAPSQTFPSSSGGTVTKVNTGAGLTGGPITNSGTISIPSAGVTNTMLANNSVTVQAGPGLSGGGTVALGGTVTLTGNLSGTTQGIAYFSSPTSVTSTSAPTNGQLLIGSTGSAPVLGTLTAGPNISITNKPGSVTISATGATLPFFVTGGAQVGTFQSFTQNVTELWGFLLPYGVTTTRITYDVTAADNTANRYDIGIFDDAGHLLVDIGPTPGTTFAPSKTFRTLAWTQGSTSLPPGRYYLGLTTNCSMPSNLQRRSLPNFASTTSCAQLAASAAYIGFAINAPAGGSQGGALPSSIAPPADSWTTGGEPAVVIQ